MQNVYPKSLEMTQLHVQGSKESRLQWLGRPLQCSYLIGHNFAEGHGRLTIPQPINGSKPPHGDVEGQGCCRRRSAPRAE